MTTTGISSAARRIWSRTRGTVIPWSGAVWVERWMVGPSARGSESGPPLSTKSAPAAATRRRASSDSSGVGNPAVRYGMSAARRVPAFPRMARQRAAIGCSDKVVADVDAVLYGVRDLHDRAGMIAFGVALREVGEESGVLHPAFGRGHDADDRSMHMGDVRIGAVHERHLVRVEDDARAHGVDPDQGEHTEPGVRLHDAPLFIAQAPLLVQHLERHA